MKPNELVVHAQEDREEVVQKMMHYHLTTVPVVNKENIFLGVIPSDTLAEVIEEEASEDIYRMSALTPIKHTYFETPFFRLLYQRSSILLVLLALQTFSAIIISLYQATLEGFLMLFITTLTSTGGNSSSQTSALAIQGMATGEINSANIKRFVRREFFMAIMIAIILGIFSFVRIYITYGGAFILKGLAVSVSLAAIVLVSVMLGSTMPLLLKRLNVDPAHSAGPMLATLMDVVGLLLYCFICQLILQ
jgi:magnesium transporter